MLFRSGFTKKRQALAARYDETLTDLEAVRPLEKVPGSSHAYHLYIIRLDLARLTVDRNQAFDALKAEGIGVNVHYRPVHLHPYYQKIWGTKAGDLPVTEQVFEQILTLPLFSSMKESDVDDVVEALRKVTRAYAR